mmetsp:Transcript_17444/g.37971  ORF Transcript_17444/g.37971 Transcript_17444/m.37971 type:complete len:167 (+) Transcript_17444:125-625(+)|eukprot:CAMPEP_0118926562 /NCGR_PEP_ID=MMETSP1169-20130426/4220_1 /TAXON_ID=36882 /ORGANISM="Pyramimonas obovata, Strain CCMP722" /LENGTH=166 /DNA_ID=CAMNT_0006868135 /DNA_START=111 /DNA_END=611 /DNA_ORIENTATION=-
MANRWKLDFGEEKGHGLPAPYSLIANADSLEESCIKGKRVEADSKLKQKKAWEIAGSPVKNLGMLAFMMWMSGNSVQIFSIGITVTALMQPIKAIIGSAQVFSRLADKDVDIIMPRLAFIGLQLGGLAMGLYKLSNMGLLPTHGSDWIEGKVPEALEFAAGGRPLS